MHDECDGPVKLKRFGHHYFGHVRKPFGGEQSFYLCFFRLVPKLILPWQRGDSPAMPRHVLLFLTLSSQHKEHHFKTAWDIQFFV